MQFFNAVATLTGIFLIFINIGYGQTESSQDIAEAQPTIISPFFIESFENHTPSADPNSQPFNLSGDNNATVSTVNVLEGTRSILSAIPISPIVEDFRSELRHKGGTGSPITVDWLHAPFTTRTFIFSFYFPHNMVFDPVEETIMQWKNQSDNGCDVGSPPFSIRVSDDNIKYNIKYDSSRCTTRPTTVYGNINNSLTRGVWHNFVVEIHYDYRLINGQGHVKIWYSEEDPVTRADSVLNYDGPVGYNDLLWPYFKVGIYKSEWKLATNREISASAGVTERKMWIDQVGIIEGPWNQGPIANAGPDKTIILPNDEVTLTGTASASDGTITSYQWTQQAGPSIANLEGADNSSLTAGSLIQGSYVFRLTVTDDQGVPAYDEASVTVEKALNQEPIVNAGLDQSITLPFNKVTLEGSGSDPDGSIVSYQWVQVSGPSNATLTTANTANTAVGDLIQGTYVFKLTASDNDDATESDEMSVIVEPATNQDPIADAGPNQILTLPDNKATLNGTAYANASITSYQWSQQSGPINAILTGVDEATMEVSALIEGIYVFRLTVIDDNGATDTDELTVTLVSSPITVSATVKDASCNAKDGSISLTVSGGKGPFSFSWSNGATSKDIAEIAPGNFQVTITDQNKTSIKKSFTVNASNTSLVVAAEIDHASCSMNNGALSVTVSGGTAPYSYQWSTGEKTSSIHQLTSGNYTLVIKDKNGCNKQVTFEVPVEPSETEFKLNSKVTNSSCSNEDGSIDLKVVGNNGPYTYTWSNGATGPKLTGLGLGVYQVLITDKQGCFMKENFIVYQNPIDVPIIVQSGDSLLVKQQATHYQWYKDGVVLEGSTQNFLRVSELGSYTVQIAEGNCTNISDPEVVVDITGFTNSYFQQVDIFPNPVSNDLKIKIQLNTSAPTSITVYDFQGTAILSKDLSIASPGTVSKLNVSDYLPGVYFIKIASGSEVVSRKFIKR